MPNQRKWPDAAIILAAREHYARYGQWPTAHQWRRTGPNHPSNQTVLDRFGSWDGFILRCGGVPRGPGRPKLRTPEGATV